MYTLLPVVVDYEIKQKLEEGCRAEPLKADFDAWLRSKGCEGLEAFYAIRDKKLSIGEEDIPFLEHLYEALLQLQSEPDPLSQPEGLEALLAEAALADQGAAARSLTEELLFDRIYGGWLGRAAGCTLGKPVELWPHERVRSYLELTGAYPLRDYIPASDPMPEGYKFKEEWRGATFGDVDGAPRDDDMDYAILNLNVVEKYGPDFTTANIGDEWLRTMPYKLVYTAERVAYKNLLNGMQPPEAGKYRNPYREWIGAQIRGDLWGWINPGRPDEAVRMAYRDGMLSHAKNGLYGEMWVAALLAIAFVEPDPETAVLRSLQYVPRGSRLRAALEQVAAWRRMHDSWEACFALIRERYGSYHTVHTINNAAVVAMALLYSGGDFERGVTTAVMAGWDTDCNGATVGSVLGVQSGASGLPSKWTAPLKDSIRTLILSDRPLTLSGLAMRTLQRAVRPHNPVGGGAI